MNRARTPEAPLAITGENFQITQVKRYSGPTVSGFEELRSTLIIASDLMWPSGYNYYLTNDFKKLDTERLFEKIRADLKVTDRSSTALDSLEMEGPAEYLVVDRFGGGNKLTIGLHPHSVWNDRSRHDQITGLLSEAVGKQKTLERIDVSVIGHKEDPGELLEDELKSLLTDATQGILSTQKDRSFIKGEGLHKLDLEDEILIKENGDGIGLYYSVQRNSQDLLVGAVQMQLLFSTMGLTTWPAYHFSVRRSLIDRDIISLINRPSSDIVVPKVEPPMAVSEPKNQRMMERVAQKIIEAFS